MAKFYSNENFPLPTVIALRKLGHDVLTSEEAGNANQQIPDDRVLHYAIEKKRAILTINRRDFIHLHQRSSQHCGIIVCTFNPRYQEQALKIDHSLHTLPSLVGQLVRVNQGNS